MDICLSRTGKRPWQFLVVRNCKQLIRVKRPLIAMLHHANCTMDKPIFEFSRQRPLASAGDLEGGYIVHAQVGILSVWKARPGIRGWLVRSGLYLEVAATSSLEPKMAPFRLRHPKGVSTIQLDIESATVQDLLQLIFSITEIPPSAQDRMYNHTLLSAHPQNLL